MIKVGRRPPKTRRIRRSTAGDVITGADGFRETTSLTFLSSHVHKQQLMNFFLKTQKCEIIGNLSGFVHEKLVMISISSKISILCIRQVSYSGPQVFSVDEAQVVGRRRDIFAVVNPQFGQQHHQLVIITHLRKKTSINNQF